MKRALLFIFLTTLSGIALGIPAQTNLACGINLDCSAPFGTGAQKHHRAYLGFVWQLNKKDFWPEAKLGLQLITTHEHNTVNGFDWSIQSLLLTPLKPTKSQLVYTLGGTRQALANLGLSYAFQKKTISGLIAAQTNFIRVGTELNRKKELTPFLEGNTLPSSHESTPLGCSSNKVLLPVAPITRDSLPDSYKGKTCAQTLLV